MTLPLPLPVDAGPGMRTVTLRLPGPPSPNRRKAAHPIARHVETDEYRARVWLAAITQRKPFRDPPRMVLLTIEHHRNRRLDDDNAVAACKPLIDALKQRHPTGNLRWRLGADGAGLYDQCGYFVDDDPGHLRLVAVTHVPVPKGLGPWVDVTITEVRGEE